MNFESILRYDILSWTSNSTADIFVIYIRILRIIDKMSPNQLRRGMFRANGILTILAVYIMETILFAFKTTFYLPLMSKSILIHGQTILVILYIH